MRQPQFLSTHTISHRAAFFSVVILTFLLRNDQYSAALYGFHFAERPIAIRKGYRTVKGTIIFCRKLRLVITRNGFCAQTKPTFHAEERLFIGKTPLPQDAEHPVFAELPTPHCAERPFTIETTHSAK
jgi:hypothetical protein